MFQAILNILTQCRFKVAALKAELAQVKNDLAACQADTAKGTETQTEAQALLDQLSEFQPSGS